MNEQACAYVCAIFSAICTILSGYATKTGDWSCMVVTAVFGAVVVLLAAYVLTCKYL